MGLQLLAANMMTEPRLVGEGASRSSFTEESVEDSEHSESASLLFLRGKLLSLIIDMVGESGEDEAAGAGIGVWNFEKVSCRRGGVASGLGGPYSSRSAFIRLFTKLAVTGKMGEPLESLGEGAFSWEVGRRVRVGRDGASPGQMELMLGRMNWASIGSDVWCVERWAGGGTREMGDLERG